MRINVLSHRAFDMWMQEFGFSDESLPDKDEAVISICCTPEIKHNYLEGHKHETDEHWFKEQHDNVLNVDFDDITTPTKSTEYGMSYGITDEQAERIVKFVLAHSDVENWYIHCRAGRCRSVAVGLFVKELMESKFNKQVNYRTTRFITYQNEFVAWKLRAALQRIENGSN